ncbi:MAG: isocitrate lyase/phosphoenolpyruvate mutase family protein [Ignavibacteriae bacterium]|nr:MAG: isocitrate lyase/phosphoenolpyruvate mutase family protein [Ignavibacteriota bacterium]
MNEVIQKNKADKLLSLHSNGRLLILPNIWDPIGARILQGKGYPAVATASAAVSSSLGYEDGEKIRLSTLLNILVRIAGSVDIPVTADIESGYAQSISQLEEVILKIIDTGVVGINIEDGLEEHGALRSLDEQCKRISKIRNVSANLGLHLVINARIDSFMSDLFPTRKSKIEEAVLRARAYSEAGADCIYPIGPGDIETLRELRDRISAPLNVLGTPNAPPLLHLQELGINRISFGPFIFRSCMKKFENIVDALHDSKGYECFGENMMSRTDITNYLIHTPE